MKKTKRTFTRSEKISYCVDKIQNLSDKGLDILSILIDNNPKLSCNKIVDIYKKGWKPVNRSTQLYWLQRGWNKEISVINHLILLKKYQNWLQTTEYFNGYSECFIKSIPLEQLKEDITFAMHNI